MTDWREKIADRDAINIIVRANSPKTEIKEYDKEMDTYRLNVKAAPEKWKANAEVVKYFSKLLKKEVKIISGLRSKRKVLRIWD